MQIDRELAARRTPDTLGAAAALQLLRGNPQRALRLLDEALARAPADARLLSDRAAALLEADRADDLAAGIAAMADRPGSSPPGTGAAGWQFNRGLVLERLGLPREAAAAFRTAAAAGDRWAEEAVTRALRLVRATTGPSWEASERRRLLGAAARDDSAAVAALVARWPIAASVVVEEDLLATLTAGSRSREQSALIAGALARRGDPFLADSMAALAREPALASAHADYVRGRSLQRQGRTEEAQALLRRAAGAFVRAGSPFAALAQLRWASCEYHQGRFERGLGRVREALQRAPAHHSGTRANLEWLGGLLELSRGDPAAALASYRSALEVYERADLEEGIATAEMLTAETWGLLGEWQEAWRHRRRALKLLPSVSDPERQRTILDESAEASAADGFLNLAGSLQDRVVESALGARNDFALGLALAQRARVRGRRGEHAAARADLAASRRRLEALPEDAFREYLEALLLMMEAGELRVTAPAEAIEKLDAAAVYYQRMERWISMRMAVMERARCQLIVGDEDAALADLRLANAVGERVREQGEFDPVRGALDEQSQPLYADLVRLELGRGRVDEAFAYSELARARQLVDKLGVEQASLHRLRSSLPSGTSLVAYHDLGARLIAFVVRRERTAVVDLQGPSLAAEVASLQRTSLASAARDDWMPRLAALESLLIAPLRPHLAGTRTLVIVPHRELAGIPFGALYDPQRGRYLIQDFRLQVAPSATVFLTALARSAALAGRPRKVLTVGSAAAPAGLASLLAPLPHASAEARAVAAAYRGAELLEGESATSARFLERARQSTVVHFSGHAVASAADPTLSFLVLSPEREDSGALYAGEIASGAWPNTGLVVLSACRTAQGSRRAAEGIQGLARAFLAAGVPAVVASLRDVEDETAKAVAVRFHRAYSSGLDAASALRAAQLSLLRDDPQAPPAWAAFEIFGGVSEIVTH